MADNNGAKISVEIGADVDKLKTGINEAQNIVEKGAKDLQSKADKNKVNINVDVSDFSKQADKSLSELQQHIKNSKFEMPNLDLNKGMNSYISKLRQQMALIKKETARDITGLGENPDLGAVNELRNKELEKQLNILKAIKLAQQNIYSGNADKLGKDNTATIKAKIDLTNTETQINQLKNKLNNINVKIKTDTAQINNEAEKAEKEFETKLRNIKAQIIIDQLKSKTVIDSLKAEISGLDKIVDLNKKNVANAQKEYDRLKNLGDEKATQSAEKLAKALQNLKASEEKLANAQEKLSSATVKNASDLDKAKNAYTNFKNGMSNYNPFSKFVTGVQKTSAVLAGFATTLATLGGAIALVDKAVASGEATYQNNGKLNTDTKDTGFLTKALKLGGSSIDEYGKFYEKMTNQFAKAEWSEKDKAQTAMMKNWGVDVYNEDGTIKNGKELFDNLADSMTKAKAVGMGDDFTADVLQGNQWLETTLEEIATYKEIISKIPSTGLSDPDKAHEAYIQFEALKMTTGQLANAVGQALLPAFVELTPNIQQFASNMVTLVKDNQEPIKSFIQLLMDLTEVLVTTAVGFGKMYDGAKKFLSDIGLYNQNEKGEYVKTDYNDLNILQKILANGLFMPVAQANNKEQNQTENDNFFDEKLTELKEFILKPFEILQETFDEITEFLENKKNDILDFISYPIDVIKDIADTIAEAFSDIIDYLYENSETAKTIIDEISPIFDSIVEWISDVIDTCCNACDDLIDWIADGIKSISDGLYEGIKSIIDTIKSWVDSVLSLFGKSENPINVDVKKPNITEPKKTQSPFRNDSERENFINKARSTKSNNSDSGSEKSGKGKKEKSEKEVDEYKLQKDELNELKQLRSEQKSLLKDLQQQQQEEIKKYGQVSEQTKSLFDRFFNEFINTNNQIQNLENVINSGATGTQKAINEIKQLRERNENEKFIQDLNNKTSNPTTDEKGYKNSLGQTILPSKTIELGKMVYDEKNDILNDKTTRLNQKIDELTHDISRVKMRSNSEEKTNELNRLINELTKTQEEFNNVQKQRAEYNGYSIDKDSVYKNINVNETPLTDIFKNVLSDTMQNFTNNNDYRQEAEQLQNVTRDTETTANNNNNQVINYNPQITVDFSNSINGDNVIDTAEEKINTVVENAQNDFATQINKINDSFSNNSFGA